MASPFPPGRPHAYTVSASAAFERIVQRESLRGARVLLPAYICSKGFEPIFEQYDIDPVFVDVDPDTYHLDPDRADPHLGDVDAVLLVHAFGLPAPADDWAERCRQADALLIEDCARALGARHDGRLAGSFGDYAIFSFPKVSPVYTGGCLVAATNDDGFELAPPTLNADLLVKTAYNALPRGIPYEREIVDRYKSLMGDRLYAIDDTESNLTDTETSESTDTTAVRELDPLTRYLFDRYLHRDHPRALTEHAHIASELRRTFRALDFDVQPNAPGRTQYTIPVTVPDDRNELVDYLHDQGHPAGKLWQNPWGLTHPKTTDEHAYPVTRELADHVLTLPIFEMSPDDVDHLDLTLRRFY